MAAIKEHDEGHSFWGLGGDLMISEGLEALYHVKDLSVTGFVEVIKHLRFFNQVMNSVVNECRRKTPDAAILLDYPGFNLRLGMKLQALGIPVYYYISPQVWAWKKGRIKTMRKFIKHIFVIFPFEEAFYQEQGIPVTFAGHPLVEKNFNLPPKAAFFKKHRLDESKPLIALLPGSRRNELDRHTKPLLETVDLLLKQKPNLQFVLASLSSLSESYYHVFAKNKAITIIQDDPYPMVAFADVAIVASGTATLETAYLGTPLVVIYKISPLSYLVGKLLVDIEHIAMPNLIIGERALPELIQSDANGKKISSEALQLLENNNHRQQMLDKLARLKTTLGSPGCAHIIATKILKDLG